MRKNIVLIVFFVLLVIGCIVPNRKSIAPVYTASNIENELYIKNLVKKNRELSDSIEALKKENQTYREAYFDMRSRFEKCLEEKE